MLTVVLGEHDSGKSLLAEQLSMESGLRDRYYVATMTVYDEEGRQRIQKHRKQREGKGFVTMEIPYDILSATGRIAYPENSLVLLECVSNLVGNEIFENPENSGITFNEEEISSFASKIADEVMALSGRVGELIAVSSVYKEDTDYDEMTNTYIRILNLVNKNLEERADKVHRCGL